MAYKTPGVLVEEIRTFPPSVVQVETAVPAFVGYTERATGPNGETLTNVPTRIESLLDYETRFGGDFEPTDYNVELDPATLAIGVVEPRDSGGTVIRYYLYRCLQNYFNNGGGPCYIVSVGSFSDTPAAGNSSPPSGLRGGLAVLASRDAPTLLLFPDGVSTTTASHGLIQVDALTQCRELQDRFVIMDLTNGDLRESLTLDPIGNFRDSVGVNDLKYGAAYYPWLYTLQETDVRFGQLRFVTGGGGVILPGVINTLTGDAAIDGLVMVVRNANTEVDAILTAIDVSAMASPLAVSAVTRNNIATLATTFDDLANAVLVVGTTDAEIRAAFGDLMILTRALALALEAATVAVNALASPNAETVNALNTHQADAAILAAVPALIGLEKHAVVMDLIDPARVVGDVENDYNALNNTVWLGGPGNTVALVPVSGAAIVGVDLATEANNAIPLVRPHFDTLYAALRAVFDTSSFIAAAAESALFANHPVMSAARDAVVRHMAIIPPSGAMAGVYSATDRTRGVWKAPANRSLRDVYGPAVALNDAQQADLNVHTTGKSVNAIRAFTGRGTLVWGARTLAGNDNEWRYVNVRRFFNMAEESIKKATEPFTFEPNDANTWVRVLAMIENFLTVQWRQGALMGAKPAKAFYVQVGLGQTMTPQDVLEGRMIVEVGMAVVRPAEFIILKFSHKMPTA